MISLLLSDMFQSFARWTDEACLQEYGFRLSELHEVEQMIARLSILEDPSPDAVAELKRLQEKYRTHWRPLRGKLEGEKD